MKLVTRKTRANNAAAEWKNQYPHVKAGDRSDDKTRIYNKLCELGPDPNEVDEIIGNGSWTRVTCEACDSEQDAAVYIKPHFYCEYENPGANYCKPCLEKALRVFE